MSSGSDLTTPDTIVLIHGLWMTPRSWESWADRYTSSRPRPAATTRRSTTTRSRSPSSHSSPGGRTSPAPPAGKKWPTTRCAGPWNTPPTRPLIIPPVGRPCTVVPRSPTST